MITLDQYFGKKTHTEVERWAAEDLLGRVNDLISEANSSCRSLVCPNTGSQISGSVNGQGDGGYRLPMSTTGSQRSSHKEARAVDVYDPGGELDAWLTDEKLEQYGLYREHPDATPGWCHLTTRAPGSGNRTFHP